MLIVIADVTSDVQRERLEREQREILSILDRIVVDRAGFMEFYREANELLACIEDSARGTVSIVKRALHTLKGNCMVFGVQTVADVCHAIETLVDAEDRLPRPDEITRLRASWDRLRERLSSVLGERDDQRVEIDSAQFDELLRAALEARSYGEIAQMIADLKLEPTKARLARVAAQARRLAQRMNKDGIEVEIDHDMLRLDPRAWASFWSAFIHAVRNAVDHGLEAAEEREQSGKAGAGRLQLRTYLEDEHFVIAISDDGRGIDWEQVAERARWLGLPHSTKANLVDALFVEGLSTSAEITEYSGRGVGLGAVRTACEERGGTVEVRSEPGQGTTFLFRFPKHALLVRPKDLLGPISSAPRERVA